MPRDQKTKRWAEQVARTAEEGYAPLEHNHQSDATGGVLDHGTALSGLSDDDHTYLNGDGTKGRKLRQIKLSIDDATDAAKIKCTVSSLWNGDAIGATDNIAKNGTTGNFTLSADGSQLIIEATGLAANCIMAHGFLSYNASAVAGLCLEVYANANDILVIAIDESAVAQDLTTLVDTGKVESIILYITTG